MNRYAVECNDISKQFGHFYALRKVTLNIEAGDIIGVLGHNGAGKSTFLKIIGTHLSPSSGTVKILGKDVKKERIEVRRNIGFLGHTSFMYDELTVEENLHFYGRMFSLNEDAREKKIDEVLELVDLDRYRHVEIKKLSHGLKKRSDLARIFLHSPTVLILDEPFSGLDEAAVKLLVEALKSQSGSTILLSSHTLELVKNVCARIIVFREGEILSDSKGS
ncbi:MAG: heme ABC exporter ATP-binding protein CcmA [Nitrososphaerales archaeon]